MFTAVAYNGQCGQTEAFRVKGTVINLKIIGQSSGRTIILVWLLGNKYGTLFKAWSGVHRVEVKLASKVTHHYSISEALWLTLSQDDKVDVSIAQGCLGWKWVAGLRP